MSRFCPVSGFLLQLALYHGLANIQVLLKIMKHSTDSLPAPPPNTFQQDRNLPPTTNLSSHPDALGVLLGLDLDGVMEVEDSFTLPAGESSFGREF